MKTLTYLFSIGFSLLVLSCAAPQQKHKEENNAAVKPDLAKEKAAVEIVLDKYRLANENENLELAKEIWANSDDIVVFGTQNDEKLIGWDAIKSALENQFANLDNILISIRDQYVKVNETGNTAWFSEILNYNYVENGKAKGFEGLRFTGVLEKENNEWRIVQSHISIPGSTNK